MAILTDPHFWLGLIQITWLNLVLSGDNAVVIALAVRTLPRRQRILGQIWGTVGAVVLRLVFVGVVTLLFRLPYVRLAGGLVLVWIAYKLVQPEEEAIGGHGRHGASFWEAVWIILVADVTMSLDNVLAIAAAAGGDMLLVTVGIAMSLPIVVVDAGLLASLMNRYPWIIWLGGGLLGFVAGKMMLEDPAVERWLGALAHVLLYPVAIGLAAVLTALGWWFHRAHRRRRAHAARAR